MLVRTACQEDASLIGQLIYDTVRSINIRDYSQAQVEAWAPDAIIFSTYAESFAYVVEEEGQILGFANITAEGYLNRFYIHHQFQGKGIGKLLLRAIEERTQSLHLEKMTTEASITARPFFISQGWVVVEQQTVDLRGLSFINFKMKKVLQEAQ